MDVNMQKGAAVNRRRRLQYVDLRLEVLNTPCTLCRGRRILKTPTAIDRRPLLHVDVHLLHLWVKVCIYRLNK